MARRIVFTFIAFLSTAILMNCSSDETAKPTMEDVVKEVAPSTSTMNAEKAARMAKEKAAMAAAAAKAKMEAAAAKATSTMTTEAGTVICTNNSDERKISVTTSDSGCSVQYEKFGEMQEVANASNRLEHCGEVQENIQNNLTTAGFTCN